MSSSHPCHREWLRCIGANGTDDSGLSTPVLMSRKALHQQVFPYQMESCHAALDLFGNYSSHSLDQPHDDSASMDSEQFRCVADFTRTEDEKSVPGVEAAHGQVRFYDSHLHLILTSSSPCPYVNLTSSSPRR